MVARRGEIPHTERMAASPNLDAAGSSPADPTAHESAAAAEPRSARKRSKRSPHPGVVLVAPKPPRHPLWAIRYINPDTGKRAYETVKGARDTTEGKKAAVKVARNKSTDIEARALELQLGAVRRSGRTVHDEIRAYQAETARSVDATGRRTSPTTLRRYRDALATFSAWLAAREVDTLDDITQAHLADFRDARMLIDSKRPGGGERKNSTVNQELKPIRQMLRRATESGRLRTVAPHEMAGAMRRLKEADPNVRCMTPEEIRATLRAALAYDAAARHGQTRMAPVIALGLLTGCRRGELAGLQVGHVLLDTITAGEPMDLIAVPNSLAKTGRERDVAATGYSPVMCELLRALTADREPDELLLSAEYGAIGCAVEGLIELGAPADFAIKTLRSTCCSYMLPLPGDMKRKAARAGHTLAIAERHYLALPRGIALTAPSLEVAMECEAELRLVLAALTAS